MDQYLSAIIIAVITGIFSVVTLFIQKKQDKVINKIDEQTMFIEKEKNLKQKITQKEKECESIVHEIMILILDTNLSILRNTQEGNINIDESVFAASETLKKKFEEIANAIKELSKEYEVVIDMTSEFQKEAEKNSK